MCAPDIFNVGSLIVCYIYGFSSCGTLLVCASPPSNMREDSHVGFTFITGAFHVGSLTPGVVPHGSVYLILAHVLSHVLYFFNQIPRLLFLFAVCFSVATV